MFLVRLLFFLQRICRFSDSFELRLTLQIKKYSSFFNLSAFKNAFYDFVAVKRSAFFFENFSDDIGDSTALIAPFTKCINAPSDQNEALIFDEFVVYSLGRNIFTTEIAALDSFGYL